jgi:hypothetical protein
MSVDGKQRADWDYTTPAGGGVSTEMPRMPGSSLRPASSIEPGTRMSLEEISRLAPTEAELELRRVPGADGQRSEPALDTTGLDPAVAREMRHAPDGLEPNLQRAAENASRIEQGFAKQLGCTVEALNAELAKAPPAMRAKMQRVLWQNPRHWEEKLGNLPNENGMRSGVFTAEEQIIYDRAIARLLDSAVRK